MSTRRGGGAATKDKKRRASKLAKENSISAEEELEIKEAFQLFANKNAEFQDEKEGVMQTEDVRRALVALGLPPDSSSELSSIISAVDPTSTGFVTYEAFVSVAAAKLHMRSDESLAAEVDAAYRLFTKGSDGPITVQHLRRIARDLKEDGNVGDDLLKDMIREANGGDNLQRGVTLEQFRDVMSRAGVF
ncbi:EF-hand superfamily Ca2+modulated protein [Talaromyces proteolyticus]|uniref:Calmodulin n=1 Tax=Talaromyces proteolyticus TaxID=1131652 RepID=A0AAD4L5B6_9EURO|nr:EF-hand superfamily Ca2+modulated protein [Talaromyces proteolyticus]KAH8705361.1 EF-hand superfamily Ca2+modulated protein [Talaromyces proteolyticus]